MEPYSPMDSDESKQAQIDSQQIDKAINLLSDHFDTVQIFCTRTENGQTVHVTMGVGNWFARYGHVIDWLRWLDKQGPEVDPTK